MIGIYQDSFIDFLKEYLGEPIKQTSKNLIVRCPWCEMNSNNKHHFHMYISLDSPIFHCFFSECHKTGLISKLVKKIKGTDTSKDFIDETKIKEILDQFEGKKIGPDIIIDSGDLPNRDPSIIIDITGNKIKTLRR